MRKPLPLAEIERRLRKIGYEMMPGPDGTLVFFQVRAAFFPYGSTRRIAYPIPEYYSNWQLIPTELIDDIILHLFFSADEDEDFWNEENVN